MSEQSPFWTPLVGKYPAFDGSQPCREYDIETLVPESREFEGEAVEVCNTCPFVAECLKFALDNGLVGVWGATTTFQRRKIQLANQRRQRLERSV